jgi:glycosyltransferase involved in cell wall biosynthesis
LKVIVVQRGARHRYAIPRILHQAGCLEYLYTDSNGSRGIGRWIGKSERLPHRLKKLADRRVQGIPHDRLRTTDTALLDPWLRWTSQSEFTYHLRRDRVFASALNRWGMGEADTVYSMMGEGWDFLVRAKERGLRVALDVFITPVAHRILASEFSAFPDWEEPDRTLHHEFEAQLDKRLRLADLLLCPSRAVMSGLSAYPSFDAAKCQVVPYGHACDVAWRAWDTVARKVLFGGAADLRKGIPYYCRAAEILSRAGDAFEFLAAGPVTEMVRTRPETRHVRFLGALRRQEFLRELRSSSVFVLPTLAEGSASVIFEALSVGVPVVTTDMAGSVITDGKEGRIVPTRDAEALAAAIREIVCDQELRASMSAEALKTAGEYTEQRWKERLLQALRDVKVE